MSRCLTYGWLMFAIEMFSTTTPTMGEEILTQKNGAKYLGWRVEKEDFRTCTKDLLKVADGTISSTSERCNTKSPPPYIFTGATVEKVDALGGTIRLSAQGEQVDLWTSGASTKKVLGTLKPGDEVDVKYSTKGTPSAVFIEKK